MIEKVLSDIQIQIDNLSSLAEEYVQERDNPEMANSCHSQIQGLENAIAIIKQYFP